MNQAALRKLASSADKLAEQAQILSVDALAMLNASSLAQPANVSGVNGKAGASGVNGAPDAIVAPSPFGLFPEIHETASIAGAFSTWFSLWGGTIGAGHSVEAWPQDREQWPAWTRGKELILRPDGLDVALFGCNAIPVRPPTVLRVKDRVRIRGYPAGVTRPDHYEVRNGFAYMDRPEDMRNGDAPSWIIQFDDGSVLAMSGMSGGVGTIVLEDASEVPAMVLITQNSRADLDGDGDGDHSSDVVELIDVWTAIMKGKERLSPAAFAS